LKVEVSRPETKVVARSGYFATSGESVALFSPEEKKLLATLPSIQANPELPLALQLLPFRYKEGRYVVPIAIEVPPDAMRFGQKGNKKNVQFEVLGVVRESPDKVIARLGGGFNIELSPEQYKVILNNNVFFRQDMELMPGNYTIDLLFKDKLSGKTAGKSEQLVLPDATKEFSTSAIVLSRHAIPIDPAAARGSTDVLSAGAIQIRPLPGKQFRPSDNLILFFELYGAAVNPDLGKPLVRVTVTLTRDGKPAMKPVDYVLTDTVETPVAHMTFAKFISLTGNAPGNYTAVVEAVDTVTRKRVTQQVPFVIVQ